MNSIDLVVFLTGGMGVLASYVWGGVYLWYHPDPSIWAGLWPPHKYNVFIMSAFFISALVAASGYVWVASNIILVFPSSVAIDVWTCLFLFSAALYMPLAIAHKRRSVFFCLLVTAVSAGMLAVQSVQQLGLTLSLPVLWLVFHCSVVDLGFWFGTWKPGAKADPIPTAFVIGE